ncbi:hypothetical protein SAMN05421739_10530 [Pontibacter chinhatensis]|uniref:Uncharacterized protein n=1 Tax=Pontibacter chinhatensis TaxID=1436961 RepID=A0A1I2WJE3_9BACT|nr:hypothetical protein SAMN05421739_10530 [Pontibacter chinhatensis]
MEGMSEYVIHTIAHFPHEACSGKYTQPAFSIPLNTGSSLCTQSQCRDKSLYHLYGLPCILQSIRSPLHKTQAILSYCCSVQDTKVYGSGH